MNNNKTEECQMDLPKMKDWTLDMTPNLPVMLVSELADSDADTELVNRLYQQDTIRYGQLLRENMRYFPESLYRTNIKDELHARRLFALVAAAFENGFDEQSQDAKQLMQIIEEQQSDLYTAIANTAADTIISYDEIIKPFFPYKFGSIADSIELFQSHVVSFLILTEVHGKKTLLSNRDLHLIHRISDYVIDPNYNIHISEDDLDYLCWCFNLENPNNIEDPTTISQYIFSCYGPKDPDYPSPTTSEALNIGLDEKELLWNDTIFYVKNTTRMYKLGDSALLKQPLSKQQLLMGFDNYYNYSNYEDFGLNYLTQAKVFIQCLAQVVLLDCFHSIKEELVTTLN
jgi:hypothetical protein